MYYRHGSFTSNDAEFGLRGYSREIVRDERGGASFERRTLSVFFEIVADGQAAIKARYDVIAGGMSIDASHSGFLHNDLTRSAIYLPEGSRTGVQVRTAPSLEPQHGADYATSHMGAFNVSAEYAVAGGTGLLDYQESLTIEGDSGPLKATIITDTGLPFLVTTANRTPVTAVQSGYAVGRDGWPAANAPIFGAPNLINPATAVTTTSPRPMGNGFTGYRIQWSFRYIFVDGPASGLPLIR
jgi:hypothetical protein